jgi:hypothetical protein
MTGYRTRWACPPEQPKDPERIAIREALAFGKVVYDRCRALGLSVADLAGRADMTTDEIECSEEGGTEPAIARLRRLATALDPRAPDCRTRPRPRAVRTPRSPSGSATRRHTHDRNERVAPAHDDAG